MKETITIPDHLMIWFKRPWNSRWSRSPSVDKPLYTRCCNCEKFGLMERVWYGPACKKCLEEEL